MATDRAPRPRAIADEVAAARSDRKLANVFHHAREASSRDEKGLRVGPRAWFDDASVTGTRAGSGSDGGGASR